MCPVEYCHRKLNSFATESEQVKTQSQRYSFFCILSDTVEADVREKYGDRVLDTVVRKNNDVAKAAFEYADVVSAYPSSNGATDFKALVDELLEKM